VDQVSGVLAGIGRARALRLALVRIELLLDDSLRPCLLACRLMLGLELHLAALADSDHRNILDSFYDPKIALGHEYSLPQFAKMTTEANRTILKYPSETWL
jgi:hypothetical protein